MTKPRTPKAIEPPEPHGRGAGRTAVDISEPHKAMLLRFGGARAQNPSVGGTAALLIARLLDRHPDLVAQVLAVSADELLEAVGKTP